MATIKHNALASVWSHGEAIRIWCVGGHDSELRIPFLEQIRALGVAATALTSGPIAPFAAAGIPVVAYRLHRFVHPWADLATLASLAKLGRQNPPDLIQTFDTKPGLYLPLALRRNRRLPVVRTINGLGSLFSPGAVLGAALRPIWAGLQRVVAPLVAMNVFQNEADQANFLARGFTTSDRARLIRGSGIDVEAFEARLPGPVHRAAIRRELGLRDSKVVVTVSRVTRQKGIGTLLEAARMLRSRRQDIVFLLVGPRQEEGPLAIPSAELERHAPYVVFLGQRRDIPEILAASDVFVLPTEFREGVPRVLLEAGVARMPVIVTDMPGCRDVIEHERSGLLIQPRDAESLAVAIERCLDGAGDSARWGAALYQDIKQRFHMKVIAEQYVKLYQEILAGIRQEDNFMKSRRCKLKS
jgi:glycosyltransferase involved in cell wall biosynthesis